MVYDLPLEEVKVKSHQVTTLHLVCALAFTGTGAIIAVYNYTFPLLGIALLVAGLLLAGSTVFRNKWTLSTSVTPPLRIAELIIATGIAILSAAEHWKFPIVIFSILSLAIAFALYWERTAGGSLHIHIDDEGIKLPVTARRRFLPWTDVAQVVLRFGILTIDCTDNRLFQYTLTDNNANSEILESYCAARVADHIEKRINNDW